MTRRGPRRLWAAATRTPWRRAAGALAAVVVAVVVAVAVVVQRGGEGATASPPTTTTAPALTTTTAPELPRPPDDGLRFVPEDIAPNGSIAPLTGLPVADPERLDRAAVAIKVDNLDLPHESARPQLGLAEADVVVEEVVEGGITRFVAVLHSTGAAEVGPVRSARTTDVDLLGAFGAPLFAYSGGNAGVVGAVRAAPRIIDRGGEWPPAYFRDPERRAPHDLFVRPDEIWAGGGGDAPPPLGAFRPESQPSPVGEPVAGVDLDVPGRDSVAISWAWLPQDRRWVRFQAGSLHVDGTGFVIGPRNVIVMATDYVRSSADPRSPEGVTVGSGEAWVFTDGKLVTARWQRSSDDVPISFTDAEGRPVSLATGRTWIELVIPGTATVVR